ncbi:hypothetical protein HA402_000790 [Bradysia odoriphaga]|nr:hypothetical protein HA402_000790 [Bradysia odoriphaga]
MSSQNYPLRRSGIYHNLPTFDPNIKGLKAIITGANGISGFYTMRALLESPERWSKVYALSRRPPPKEMLNLLTKEQQSRVQHVACDFLQSVSTIADAMKEAGVTGDYVFFYSYLQPPHPPGSRLWSNASELVKVNSALFENFLRALEEANVKPRRVLLQTGAKNYGVHIGRARTPACESDPQPKNLQPNFYYDQEKSLFEYCERNPTTGWNIIRPGLIVGAVTNAQMNGLHPFAVYAAVQAHRGLPIRFGGDWKNWQDSCCYSTARLTGYLISASTTDELGASKDGPTSTEVQSNKAALDSECNAWQKRFGNHETAEEIDTESFERDVADFQKFLLKANQRLPGPQHPSVKFYRLRQQKKNRKVLSAQQSRSSNPQRTDAKSAPINKIPGYFTKGLDVMIRRSVKEIIGIPQRSNDNLFYAPRKLRGLGLLRAEWEVHLQHFAIANKLSKVDDGLFQSIAKCDEEMTACISALNAEGDTTKVLRAALRNEAYDRWCNLSYQGSGVIHFGQHTASNDFVYNKNSLSSSEWVAAIKLSINYANLNGVPGVSNSSSLCRKCERENETIAHVTGSCPSSSLLVTSRHHSVKHIIAELLREKGFICFCEVYAIDTEGKSRFSDIIAFDPKSNNAYIIDPTIRYETNDRNQDESIAKEKREIYEKCIPFYAERYRNSYGERNWWYGVSGYKGPEEDDQKYTVIVGRDGKDSPMGYGPSLDTRSTFTLDQWANDPVNRNAWQEIMKLSNGTITHDPFQDISAHFSCADLAWLPLTLCTNKARRMGWTGFVDTMESAFEMYRDMVGLAGASIR